MTIAVHISNFENPASSFLYQLATRFAAQQPNDHVLLFCSPKFLVPDTPPNCTVIKVMPAIRNSLLLHYWYNYKLPSLLKRYAADVFFSDSSIISQQVTLPQFLVFDQLIFPLRRNKFHRYIAKFLPVFFTKAKGIIVPSAAVAANIIHKNPVVSDKTHTIPYGINNNLQPVDWKTKELFTETITSGKDYFLFPLNEATKPNLLAVIKAFSLFKKWQKSSIQLVLMTEIPTENLIPNFENYKYREEVKIINPVSEQHRASIISAAYGAVYLPAIYLAKNIAIDMMQCAIPVIAAKAEFLETDLENAALFTTSDEKAIADNMMLLYKDENLRALMIYNGHELAQRTQWSSSLQQFAAVL